MHAVFPVVEMALPETQSVQEERPVPVLILPAAQFVHEGEPPSEYFPAAHRLQEGEARVEYSPGEQSKHELLLLAEVLPAEHEAHVVEPVEAAYFPALHSVQVASPSTE
jgi:hypothetical protein